MYNYAALGNAYVFINLNLGIKNLEGL